MGGFGSGPRGDAEQGKGQGSRSPLNGDMGMASGFGRRKERPDMDLMQVLNTGSSGPTRRVPRSVSPPLD